MQGLRVAAVLVASLLGLPPIQASQSTKAHSGPISDNLVRVRVTMNGRAGVIAVREGELARLGGTETTWGLAGRLTEDRKLDVRAFRITELDGGGEAVEQVDRATLGVASPVTLKNSALAVELLSIEKLDLGDLPTKATSSPVPPGEDCCVVCGDGFYMCGNCVWIDCGCCCDDWACQSCRHCQLGP